VHICANTEKSRQQIQPSSGWVPTRQLRHVLSCQPRECIKMLMRRTMNVVAATWMEAREHKSIPKIGYIKNGWRLIAKRPCQVLGFPKWWIVALDYEKVKIGWRKIDLRKSVT
jgi:hypothetical protein